MNQLGIVLLPALMLVAACADQESQSEGAFAADTDSAIVDEPAALALGDIVANNVIIDHDGATLAIGDFKIAFGQPDPETGEMVFTRQFGAPTLAGPVIVYVFKSITPDNAEHYKDLEIEIEENTAYLLPHGATPNSEAFMKMQRIGPIDPSLSNDELGALFGIGTEGDETPNAQDEQN
ncbi:MAG: hypothetical protein GXP06_05135 [Alphaproteobacteria bacterium]|nr:hypothetical protein [Alphaproteobacteria bacterium]